MHTYTTAPLHLSTTGLPSESPFEFRTSKEASLSLGGIDDDIIGSVLQHLETKTLSRLSQASAPMLDIPW